MADQHTVPIVFPGRLPWWRKRHWQLIFVSGFLLLLAIWLAFLSPWFRVQKVSVDGAGFLTEKFIKKVAAVPVGEPMITLPRDQIIKRLQGLPPVKQVRITRQWPNQVKISVIERVAVVAVPEASGWKGMDAKGVIFRPFQRKPSQIPTLRLGKDVSISARREGAAVAGSLPSGLLSHLEYVEVSSLDQINLLLKRPQRMVKVRWGSAENSAEKAEVLVALLRENPSAVDVSAPTHPAYRK